MATALPGSVERAGTVYDPVTLAGAQPVWFHSNKDGSYLMAMRRTWSAATVPSGQRVGVYSAFTESTVPTWTNIIGGAAFPMPQAGVIPLRTAVDSATLAAGASRPPLMMWLLHSVSINSTTQAVLQHFDVAANGSVTNGGEEVLPTLQGVVFDKGIQLADLYLYAYGTDVHGHLYRIRKSWSRVGFNQTNPAKDRIPFGATWEYYTGTGWSSSSIVGSAHVLWQSSPAALAAAELGQVQDGVGSAGPVSFGYWNNIVVMSTVVAQSASGPMVESVDAAQIAALTLTKRRGRVWVSRAGRPWVADPSVDVDLGDTAVGSYLGGGLQLQSSVGPSSLAGSANGGIVYVTSVKTTAGGNHSLQDSWGVYPIQLVG